MTSSRHNPLRSYRFLVPGILAVVLGAGWTPATAQTPTDAARRTESVLTSPLAEVAAGPQARRYTQTFTASGGVMPYTFTVTGNIPAGMSWTQAENGLLLDGVPMTVGDFPLSIKVTDQTGQVSSHDYVLHVTPYDTGSSLNIPASEAVSVTDVPVIGFAIPVSVSESVSVSDAPSVVFPVLVSVTEAVSVSDSVSFPNFVFVSVTEGVSVSDSASFPTVASVSVTEAVQVADSVSLPSVASVSVVEAVSVTDTVSFPNFVLVSVGESVSVSDSVSLPALTSIAVTEAVSVDDTGSLGSPIAITVAEPISVTDVVSALPPQASQTINLGPLPTPTFGGAPFSISATATSGLPVTIAYVSGPATGSGSGPYTATGTGTVNFTATQAGNANYAAATPVNFSVTIGAASQSITIGTLPSPTYGGAPFSISATATSGLPVTIAYVSGPATGSGNGPYTATGTGTVNFTATQAGNANYAAAAPVNFSVTINAASQSITIGTLPSPTFGGSPFSVSATASSGLPVTIAYVSGPATGSGNGPYTATGAGTVNFTATQAGNSNYAAAAPVNFSVTIAPASQSITLGTLPTPTYGGAPFSLSATASSGLPVTFTYISGPATGSGSGPYTATAGGVVNFTATQAGNANYAAAAPVNFSVNIAQASQSITIGPLPTPAYGGAPFSLSATASSGLPVTISYISGPASGAGNGPYIPTGAGTVNFTASQAGNPSYLPATPVNFSLSVAKQASVTTVSANPLSITPVQTTTLTANVAAAFTGSPTGTVTFFDNGVPIGSPVAVVGGRAQLTTLLLSGSQAISATYSGDGNFLASSSTTSATVSVAPLDFTMTPLSSVSLNVVPGSSAVVSFNVTPLYLIYPAPVTFSVSGLPSNAKYTVTPTSVAANGGPQTVTVTIQTAPALVQNARPFGPRSAPLALALFVPLLALGTLRRRRRWLSALVLMLGAFAGSAVVGCGANGGNGFFGQAPQTYPVVITATSGTVQHTINVSLVIQ